VAWLIMPMTMIVMSTIARRLSGSLVAISQEWRLGSLIVLLSTWFITIIMSRQSTIALRITQAFTLLHNL
jgi:hypothetical protein